MHGEWPEDDPNLPPPTWVAYLVGWLVFGAIGLLVLVNVWAIATWAAR